MAIRSANNARGVREFGRRELAVGAVGEPMTAVWIRARIDPAA